MTALRANLDPAPADRFRLVTQADGSYFAVDFAGRACLLVPTIGGSSVVGRDIGGLSISHGGTLRFEMLGEAWTTSAVVVTCLDDDLLSTFCTLALDVARNAGGVERPSAREVFTYVTKWERLLRARRRLSTEEELGLWGELFILSRMDRLDMAVQAWRGPSRAPVDFHFGGKTLECKTSIVRLRHQFSQQQLERPAGDATAYLVSVWVGPDPEGDSLPDLVRRIDSGLADPTTFEVQLLSAGYSRGDSLLYRQRYAALEEPMVFALAEIPRVRTFDAGVSAIRFTVTLDDRVAVSRDVSTKLLRGPSPPRAP